MVEAVEPAMSSYFPMEGLDFGSRLFLVAPWQRFFILRRCLRRSSIVILSSSDTVPSVTFYMSECDTLTRYTAHAMMMIT